MRRLVSNHRSAAIIGVVRWLPISLLLSLISLDIDARLRPLDLLLRAADSHARSMVVSGLFMLLLLAFFMGIAPVIEGMQAGNGIAVHPINLMLAIAALVLLAVMLGCWTWLAVSQTACSERQSFLATPCPRQRGMPAPPACDADPCAPACTGGGPR